MFEVKDEKASFKLENESQPNIRHFGDRYIQGHEQEAIH